jgi:hypothetical protein
LRKAKLIYINMRGKGWSPPIEKRINKMISRLGLCLLIGGLETYMWRSV